MFRIITMVNGEPLTGGKGFKPFKSRRLADEHAVSLNRYAAAAAPALRTHGMVVTYVVVEDEQSDTCAR